MNEIFAEMKKQFPDGENDVVLSVTEMAHKDYIKFFSLSIKASVEA